MALADASPESDDPVPAGDFARDTDVWPDPAVAGRFRADLPEAWKVFYAFGGCTMAVALRAAQRSLDRPDLDPVAATAVFAAPVPCGPLTVDTRVLRSGRSAAQVTADLRPGHDDSDGSDGNDSGGNGSDGSDGSDGNAGEGNAGEGNAGDGSHRGERGAENGASLHLSAVFGAPHQTHVSFVEAVFPDDALEVEQTEEPPPPPDDSPFRGINYHNQTEWRPAMRGMAFRSADDWIPGPARSLSWHRLIKEPRLPDGTIDPVALCSPADILGPAVFSRLGPLGPDNPPFLVLSLEISVQFVAPTTSPWILQHARIPVAGDGYAVSHVELWDVDRRLVALATQTGHIRPVAPDRFASPDGTA